MYIAVIAFTGDSAMKVQIEEVGRFGSEDEAESAIADYIEGTLELERPGFKGLASEIIKV